MQKPNSLSVNIQWPSFQQRLSNLANTFSDLKANISSKWIMLQEATQDLVNTFSDTKQKSAFVIGSKIRKPEFKKKLGQGLLFIFMVLIVFFGIRFAMSRTASSEGQQLGVVNTPGTLATSIEREFNFNVYDKDKKLADPIKYVITTAQLTKQIIIKGTKATAIEGRMFLIINLKLVNDFDKSLFLNTRNYIRVQPAGTVDKLASEIHNDTVEVQPLSTKLTRVGLPVDEGIKDFILFVGELDGQKTEIPISF